MTDTQHPKPAPFSIGQRVVNKFTEQVGTVVKIILASPFHKEALLDDACLVKLEAPSAQDHWEVITLANNQNWDIADSPDDGQLSFASDRP